VEGYLAGRLQADLAVPQPSLNSTRLGLHLRFAQAVFSPLFR